MKAKMSVIIPVKNSETTIEKCIKSILKSNFRNFELIVVYSDSTDNTINILKKFPVKIINTKLDGAGIARNLGAKYSKGNILVFVDSDIVVRKNTLKKLYETIKMNSNVDAVVATPDKNKRYKSFISEYENLYLNYSFTRHNKETSNLHSSTFAIRRDVFFKADGFNEKIKGTEQEDREFGERLIRMNFKVWFLKNLKVIHLKEYNINSFVRTRINRSRGYIKNTIKYKIIKDHIPLGLKLGVPMIYIALLFLPFNYFLSSILITIFVLLNLDFLKFLQKERNLVFSLKSLLILIFDMIILGIGLLRGILDYVRGHGY